MSDKIKEVMQTPEVPEELKPENIPSLIERNKIMSNKTNTKNIIRWVSAIAACAVLTVGAVNIIPNMQNKSEMQIENTETSDNSEMADEEMSAESSDDAIAEDLYFTHPESYDEIYQQMKKNVREQQKNNGGLGGFFDRLFGGNEKTENATGEIYLESPAEDMIQGDMATNDGGMASEEEAVADDAVSNADTAGGSGSDVYDTLQQVEGIAEADIIKANSECIYFISNYKANCLVSVEINSDGTFGNQTTFDFHENTDKECYANEMYLSGDKLIVISTVNDYDDNQYYSYSGTEVMVFDVSAKAPELKETYYQSGGYSDSRMKGDILYLTTNQNSYYAATYDGDDYSKYIPTCGNSYDDSECISSEDIYIPKDWNNQTSSVSYVNIAGLDINSISKPVSIVSVAGFNGEMYCSNNNIYITQRNYNNDGSEKTEITRFSVNEGVITPEKSGKVDGYVLNQFSMDEYEGYFRIATTSSHTNYYREVYDEEEGFVASYGSGRSNNVFVLDMDMNTVGKITGIAETESIKSVTFKGKIGYVVTYEQTDPLFAIDFSEPTNPVITDEFKINGYSSFLWNWSDDLLLGFGVDANEQALELGVKLVMFDVSDNGDLQECGIASIRGDYAHSVTSDAVYDRKALLLSSERNIIGFPTTANVDNTVYAYHLFCYENGKFRETGSVTSSSMPFVRAVYAGDYIYMFTDDSAVSADIKTMTQKDEITFDIPESNYRIIYDDICE